MVKQDIIEHLTHNCGLHRSSAITAVEGMMEIISRSLMKGENVYLRGFGTFKLRRASEKLARDINAGRPITVPAHNTVKFIPATQLKEAIK